MTKSTERGLEIRRFIVRSTPDHPRDLVAVVGAQFGITRQAVNRYVRDLVLEGKIRAEGRTSQRTYALRVLKSEEFKVPLAGLEEDQIWRTRVLPHCADLPANVRDIWHYAVTEMVNNAVEHSNGTRLTVHIEATALFTKIIVDDDGIGIFKKIKTECGLEDERHAILELAKGKLTTDPEGHTGEGIFFTSRLLDGFALVSGGVYFSHEHADDKDWAVEQEQPLDGTMVVMSIQNDSARRSKDVFDRFASADEDFGFTRTVVPVRLARHGQENLVSRSQAKRLLARVDRFKTVVLDFTDVLDVGQAFADEIFRVFVRNHPDTMVLPINAEPDVKRMIERARRHGQ